MANIPTPQIPAYPGPPATFATGPDPLLFIPRTLAGRAGGTISVPVNLLQTNGTAISLGSFDLVLKYDPSTFQFLDIKPGRDPPAGFQITAHVDAAHGLIYVSAYTTQAVTLAPGTLGDLIRADFEVAWRAPGPAGRRSTSSPIRETRPSLNGGDLTLVPARPTRRTTRSTVWSRLEAPRPGPQHRHPRESPATPPHSWKPWTRRSGRCTGSPTGTNPSSPTAAAPAPPSSVSGRTITVARPPQSAPTIELVALSHRGSSHACPDG